VALALAFTWAVLLPVVFTLAVTLAVTLD